MAKVILQKNNYFVVKDVGSVNGVHSFSTTSDAATSLKGSKFRVGQPSYVMTWDSEKVVSGKSTSSPDVSVYVAGTDEKDAPLFYIDTKDGMKQVEDFNDIDPKDIQSMEVFKGEKAIEKFGKKAENGAIIIKLKKDPK